jgi:protein TonB
MLSWLSLLLLSIIIIPQLRHAATDIPKKIIEDIITITPPPVIIPDVPPSQPQSSQTVTPPTQSQQHDDLATEVVPDIRIKPQMIQPPVLNHQQNIGPIGIPSSLQGLPRIGGPGGGSSLGSGTDEIIDIPDEMPEFPGGMSALYDYLHKNTKIPLDAINQGLSAKVFVQFVVEPNGQISMVESLNQAPDMLVQEALRVISNMPEWSPGKNNGKPVRVAYTIPIEFKVER